MNLTISGRPSDDGYPKISVQQAAYCADCLQFIPIGTIVSWVQTKWREGEDQFPRPGLYHTECLKALTAKPETQ